MGLWPWQEEAHLRRRARLWPRVRSCWSVGVSAICAPPCSGFLVSPSFLWMNLMEAVMKFVSRSRCFLRDQLSWNQWLLKQAWPQSRLQGMVLGVLSRHSGGIYRCRCGSLIASRSSFRGGVTVVLYCYTY